MAVQTAASVIRENVGSLTLHIFNFTAVTSNDTFVTGLGGAILGAFANSGFQGGTTPAVASLGVFNSTTTPGTLTLSGMTAASPVNLFVVSKS